MKAYCPTCGNAHTNDSASCNLCGTEIDGPQMELAARNMVMRRAIGLWKEAKSPNAMEGQFLQQAEQDVEKEMEDKVVRHMHKMADEAASLIKRAAECCREAAHEGQAYDWQVTANESLRRVVNIVELIGGKSPPAIKQENKKKKKGFHWAPSSEVGPTTADADANEMPPRIKLATDYISRRATRPANEVSYMGEDPAPEPPYQGQESPVLPMRTGEKRAAKKICSDDKHVTRKIDLDEMAREKYTMDVAESPARETGISSYDEFIALRPAQEDDGGF